MGDQQCIGCAMKERDIKDRDRDIDRLTRELAESRQKATADFPTVAEFVDHCEGGRCASHAKDLEIVKQQIVKQTIDTLPEDVVRSRAAALGLQALPDKIAIKVG